jgi:CyaY protein
MNTKTHSLSEPIVQALTSAQYTQLTREVFLAIEAQIDDWLQCDVVDIDISANGGMLELGFVNGSKIILNTQPPLLEIWLAAQSGGYHYKFTDKGWRDFKEGTELFEHLSRCVSQQANQPLSFGPLASLAAKPPN